jgi:hypothetical protein
MCFRFRGRVLTYTRINYFTNKRKLPSPLYFTSLAPPSTRQFSDMNTCFHCQVRILFPMARQTLGGLGLLIFRRFAITHFRHTTLGRTPLDEGPARCRDLYLTTHSTHKRQTSMPPAGFEPTIPASERPKTHALDRATTGISQVRNNCMYSLWLR